MKLLLVLVSIVVASVASILSPAGTLREDDVVQLEGTITAWKLEMDGALYVRIKGVDTIADDSDESKESELWCQTPPDRSSVISVEEMLFGLILAREAGSDAAKLTVSAQRDREHGGASPEEALSITAIGVL